MPVIRSGPGYNGVTGAKATYNEAEDMWIDTNGERIRPDAIVPGEAPAKAATPQAPTSAAAGSTAAGTPGATADGGGGVGAAGGGSDGAALSGLRAALSPTPQTPTMMSMGTPAEGNPNLGQRNLPITALKLALRQSQIGRVY